MRDQQEKANDKYRTNKELLANGLAFPTLVHIHVLPWDHDWLPGGRDSVLLLLFLYLKHNVKLDLEDKRVCGGKSKN